MTLQEVSKELRALASLANDLADQVDKVGDGLIKAFKGVGLGLAEELAVAAKTPKRLIANIHNSMSSTGVPRKTLRRLTDEEKQTIRSEYESLPFNQRTKSARESLGKKYHCTTRQVAGLVANNVAGLVAARRAKAQLREQVQ